MIAFGISVLYFCAGLVGLGIAFVGGAFVLCLLLAIPIALVQWIGGFACATPIGPPPSPAKPPEPAKQMPAWVNWMIFWLILFIWLGGLVIDRAKAQNETTIVKTIRETPAKIRPEPSSTATLTPAPVPKKYPPLIKIGRYPAYLVGVKALPPPEYDHHYEGYLTIKIVNSYAEIIETCKPASTTYTLACARRSSNGDYCQIWMVNDDLIKKRGYVTEIMLRHEIGHCNGWPGNHPDERPLPAF